MSSLRLWIFAHKKTSIVIFIFIVLCAYEGTKVFGTTATETHYVLGNVTKGTIVSTVTGSGQVSASNEFSLKTKNAGEIIALKAKVGDEIKQGDLIAEVDPGTAGLALENAKLSYDQKFSSDGSTALQDQNDVISASSTLNTSYEQGASTVSSSYASMGDALNSLKALYQNGGYLSSGNNGSFSQTAKDASDTANGTYIDAQNLLNQVTSSAIKTDSPEAIKKALADAKNVAQKVVVAALDAQRAADIVRIGGNDDTKDETARSTIASIVNSVNSIITSLNFSSNDIITDEANFQEKQKTLNDLQSGVNSVDISSAQLALANQEQAYQDYFTYAPFDGVLASLDIKKGDVVSSGASIGTFITKSQVADVSLNEVDVSKVKTGDKVTLTFDAVDGLTITGEVVQIDLVGTVSQGVVNYNVKIAFDTSDDRVKSGMSVSASIITDIRQNVLTVPTSAIKTASDGSSYVEMFSPALSNTGGSSGVASTVAPNQQTVETGLSDNSNTEITSGLAEGDQIVTKTVAVSTTKTTTTKTATSLLGTGGARVGGGTGGGAFRGN